MKNKQEGGFSLIEVVLAMVILALIVVPTCTSLVLSFRVNAKADAMLQAQLAVSSAVETLMAEGISGEVDAERFPDVVITVAPVTENGTAMPYYKVTVSDKNMTDDETPVADPLVVVETTIRAGGGS